MKTRLCLFLALFCLTAPLALAAQVQMAPKKSAGAAPRLKQGEGGLTITNRDWVDYYVNVDTKGRVDLSLTSPGRKAVKIASGDTVSLPLQAESWDVYGNTGERLTVGIHPGEFTQLQLVPTGEAGSSGLQGIAQYQNYRYSGDLFKLGSVTQMPGYGSYGQSDQAFGIGTGAQVGGQQDIESRVDSVVDQILGRSSGPQQNQQGSPFGQGAQPQSQNPFDQFNQQQQDQGGFGQQQGYGQQQYGQQQYTQPYGQQQQQGSDVGSIVDSLVDSILGGNR